MYNETTARLVDLAMAFYENMEAPDASDYDYLFTLVAERDEAELRSWLEEKGLDLGDD